MRRRGGSIIAAVEGPLLSLGLAHTIAVIGVLSVVVLALRPGFVSLSPEAHRRRYFAPRGMGRRLLVLTAGLAAYFYRRYPDQSAGSVVSLNARGL